jgi:hypothetical protein
MKILFTGASSFTGMWFVRELAAAGHDVVPPFKVKTPIPMKGYVGRGL